MNFWAVTKLSACLFLTPSDQLGNLRLSLCETKSEVFNSYKNGESLSFKKEKKEGREEGKERRRKKEGERKGKKRGREEVCLNEKVQNIKQMKWSCSVRGRSEEAGADPPGQMIAVSFPRVGGSR